MNKKLDFINLKYRPKGKDLICLFKIDPAKGLSVKEAANTVALESSVGTWTSVKKIDYYEKLKAKVFSLGGHLVKIAYPQELFEYDNIPNILSSIAGNIMGMKAVNSIRLEDISFPKSILRKYKGPQYGIKGIRKMMKVKGRPLVGTIIKPKLGLNVRHHAESAYESWIGGCDIVKDDENLSSQKFNNFEKRIAKTLDMADKAEKETGEKKGYLANVTAETNKMIQRAQAVQDLGGKYIMVDVITSGWAAVQTLREVGFKMAIHAHRAMHAAFDRNPDHGISMMVMADFARLAGMDQLHIGTGIGKLEGDINVIKEIEQEIENSKVKETKIRLEQNWRNIKSTLAVSSGGLHPGHVPFLMKNLGNDLVIQMGGGIHGHPDGTRAGAKASRQAVNAVLNHQSLGEYSKLRKELRRALVYWKYFRK
ncbi:type III ribulose-bisphosphate carboxylase [archaeon]|jgi:ribulose-bisphosphate carboxylase large chain|nr:type III ribulose-bisphosphate carboxylase [archaeon]MBT4373307.1 type III ribulose-bisphosphate carboxylase [archaeon]MBT4531652.1 type III ribulose-bisphosphate carboxylase [archaeon]MBT7001170.1 type III ribulose-bisphosphate carboxylase [archaeon]MBT7282344.1 type III ribulose-bisphosphate carboxylase [archaeon]